MIAMNSSGAKHSQDLYQELLHPGQTRRTRKVFWEKDINIPIGGVKTSVYISAFSEYCIVLSEHRQTSLSCFWLKCTFICIYFSLSIQTKIGARTERQQAALGVEERASGVQQEHNQTFYSFSSHSRSSMRDHVLCSLQMKIADKIFEICINMNHLSTKWNVHFFLFMLWH